MDGHDAGSSGGNGQWGLPKRLSDVRLPCHDRAGLGLQDADDVNRIDICFVFGLFLGSQLPLIALLGQLINPGLNLWRRSHFRELLGELERHHLADRFKELVEDAIRCKVGPVHIVPQLMEKDPGLDKALGTLIP